MRTAITFAPPQPGTATKRTNFQQGAEREFPPLLLGRRGPGRGGLVQFTISALITLVACSSISSNSPDIAAAQTVKHFQFKSHDSQSVGYLLFLPKAYEQTNHQRWPLILFLHGAGERGTDVWKVATHGPPKYVRAHPEFPFILVSPQCPDGQVWSREVLLALLDEITKQYRVDATRIYVTGLSMGGYGTWDLGFSHPEKFAAIVPICGGADYITMLLAREKSKALQALAVWAFHGAKDPVVPLSESQRVVDFLKKGGAAEVKFTVYPDAQHDSWTQTYDNPELYQWLLAHRRSL